MQVTKVAAIERLKEEVRLRGMERLKEEVAAAEAAELQRRAAVVDSHTAAEALRRCAAAAQHQQHSDSRAYYVGWVGRNSTEVAVGGGGGGKKNGNGSNMEVGGGIDGSRHQVRQCTARHDRDDDAAHQGPTEDSNAM